MPYDADGNWYDEEIPTAGQWPEPVSTSMPVDASNRGYFPYDPSAGSSYTSDPWGPIDLSQGIGYAPPPDAQSGLSPYESVLQNQGQAAADAFLGATNDYYANFANPDGTPINPEHANTNWYDPASYAWLTNVPGQPASSTQAPTTQTPTTHTPTNASAPSPTQGGSTSPRSAPTPYQQYLGTPTDPRLTSLLEQMLGQQSSDRDRQASEREQMRSMLLARMGQAGAPVDANAPGIREILSSQRIARQRSAERQRSQAAVRLASEGLSDSGAFDTTLSGIEQQRGEGESSDIANVLYQEHQAKRNELMQLYQMAISMGDAESARTLQQQIAALDAMLQQQNMAGVNSRFGADLGFRQSSFMDNLSLQLLLAEMRANESAARYFQ